MSSNFRKISYSFLNWPHLTLTYKKKNSNSAIIIRFINKKKKKLALIFLSKKPTKFVFYLKIDVIICKVSFKTCFFVRAKK